MVETLQVLRTAENRMILIIPEQFAHLPETTCDRPPERGMGNLFY